MEHYRNIEQAVQDAVQSESLAPQADISNPA